MFGEFSRSLTGYILPESFIRGKHEDEIELSGEPPRSEELGQLFKLPSQVLHWANNREGTKVSWLECIGSP